MEQNQNLQTKHQNSLSGDYGSNQDYLKKVDHDADMEDIRKRLDDLEGRVKTNENFGKTFASAATDSVKLQTTVSDIIKSLLKDDTTTKDSVSVVIKDIDGRQTKTQLLILGKIGIWTLSLIVTASVTAWITASVTSQATKSQSNSQSTSR